MSIDITFPKDKGFSMSWLTNNKFHTITDEKRKREKERKKEREKKEKKKEKRKKKRERKVKRQ